jgi:ATP-dependent DNA helicase DinG
MVTPVRASSAVRRFFSRHGELSRWHPNYEFRPGQVEMAEAVEAALAGRKHLIVEAGTGTGKTLAYLAPVVFSGKRVVVSTGTKNLQEQLFFKDIPFLQRHLDRPLRVCYMKGRANYACRQKIYDTETNPVLDGLEEATDFDLILNWEKTTESGDRAELIRLPESSSAWSKLDARAELCTGAKCNQFERCFITLMHQRAAQSDIIIVNHALFFADLALKQNGAMGILPEFAAVVFDEAHELEDIAGQYFGVSVSSHQIHELRRDAAVIARMKGFGSVELDLAFERLDYASDLFFELFADVEGRTGFSNRETVTEEHAGRYDTLRLALSLIENFLRSVADPPEEMKLLIPRAAQISHALKFVVESQDVGYVYWIERRGRAIVLQATPVDVAPILSEYLFEIVDTTVLTSATLAVAGGLSFIESRLGVRHAQTLVVPSHFDYTKQALLYVPQHLPEPGNPAFVKPASEEVAEILRLSRGRAFVLFTSYQQMRLMYDRIAFETGFPALLQGTKPRGALLEEFRNTPNAVLFATSSFWQGVDVPGDQLSCVIIDKLPFSVPNDPVVLARIQRVREQGGDPFYDYQVPQAAIALKQGFGRLIRSASDRGVLVLLDHRITRRKYGQVFFDSLPDYRFTTDRSDVERFFNV